MSKFNRTTGHARWVTGRSPVQTEPDVTTPTYEGAPAHARQPKGELFQLAVVNMGSEATFYESADGRDERYARLVRQVALDDPTWLVNMIRWLRNDAYMRTASVVATAEMARAWQTNGAQAMAQAESWTGKAGPVRYATYLGLARADEPGELLGYWLSRFGRALPKGLKRGLADAVCGLYNEYSLLKYDTDRAEVRFADVIELTHPKPVNPGQAALFRYALDRRHGRPLSTDGAVALPMIARNIWVRAIAREQPEVLLTACQDRATGLTWEDALSLGGELGLDKRKLWESIIQNVGYMAMLRNLRNLDRAGVGQEAIDLVRARLIDPEQVRRSKQFPFRFYNAYVSTDSDTWRRELGEALQLSLGNLPALPGRTLVLVDTSGSMRAGYSKRGTMDMVTAAALFGVALAAKGERIDLVGFAERSFPFEVRKGASVLRKTEEFCQRVGSVGYGTMIAKAVKNNYRGHDRVVIITDMQTFGWDNWNYGPVKDAVPANVPMYAFNLAGYASTLIDTSQPNRHELGGLTDATFRMIPLLERGEDAPWPWEQRD